MPFKMEEEYFDGNKELIVEDEILNDEPEPDWDSATSVFSQSATVTVVGEPEPLEPVVVEIIPEEDALINAEEGDLDEDDRLEIEEDEEEKNNEDFDLIREMRGLLTNYPLYINFSEKKDLLSMMQNVIIIKDLLDYCKNKSKKELVKKKIEEETNALTSRINFQRLYSLSLELNNFSAYGKSRIMNEMNSILGENMMFISEKIQFFLLAIPTRGKRNMHLGTSHGLPAASAEEFESSEIERGKSIKPGQKFSLDEEGEIIPVD